LFLFLNRFEYHSAGFTLFQAGFEKITVILISCRLEFWQWRLMVMPLKKTIKFSKDDLKV